MYYITLLLIPCSSSIRCFRSFSRCLINGCYFQVWFQNRRSRWRKSLKNQPSTGPNSDISNPTGIFQLSLGVSRHCNQRPSDPVSHFSCHLPAALCSSTATSMPIWHQTLHRIHKLSRQCLTLLYQFQLTRPSWPVSHPWAVTRFNRSRFPAWRIATRPTII